MVGVVAAAPARGKHGRMEAGIAAKRS